MMLRAVGVTLVCLIILATTTSTQQVRRRKKTTLAGKMTPTPHQAGGSTPAAGGGTCGQGKYLDLLFVVGYPTVVNTEDYEEQEDSYENEYRSDEVSTVPPPGPPPDWKHILDFCASLVNSTRNEFTKTRVGMVTFHKTAQVVFGLNENEGIDNIIKAINAVKEIETDVTHLDSLIDLNDALGLVPSTLRPHNDTLCMANSVNVAIIITDAEDNVPAKDTPLTINHATTAKSLGIKLWMVPVTHIQDKINYPRWEQIVSDKQNDIFNVSSFLTIDSVLPAIESRLKSLPTGGATAAPPGPTEHSGTPGSTKKTHRPLKTKATKVTKVTMRTHKTHKPGPGPRTTPLKLQTTQHQPPQPQPTVPTTILSPAPPAPGTTPKPHNGTRDIALTCNNTIIDVALVIDMSATLPHRKYLVTEAWNTTAAFLKKLIDASDISENASHVAIVTYFDKADVVYYLYENQTKAAVTKAIDSINFHHDAHTDLVGALRLLQSDVFDGVFSAARNVSRRALIIAHSDDDVPEPESKMLDHTFITLLAGLDVRMYAIAVGKGIHGDRLKDLTLSPEKDFFSVPDPAGLDALVPAVAADFFCIRNKSKEAESESDYESDEDEEEEGADVEEYDEEADDEEKSDERELKLTVFTGCEQRTGTRGKVTATIFDADYRGDFELQLPSGQYFDPGSVHTFTVRVPNKLDDPQISFKPEKTTGRGWHLWKAVLVDEEEDDHYVLKCDCKIKGQSEQEPQPLKRVAAKRVDKILTETCDKKV